MKNNWTPPPASINLTDRFGLRSLTQPLQRPIESLQVIYEYFGILIQIRDTART